MGASQIATPDAAHLEAQLAELWRESAEDGQPVVRACAHNLIVICADENDLETATRLVARVSESEPGRALVFAPIPAASGPGDIEAHVSAHCHRRSGGKLVCCEQITLKAAGEGLHLVPGTILQLLVGDMPAYTVWRRSELAGTPLMTGLRDLTDRLIVDSGDAADPALRLAELNTLRSDPRWRGQIADATWGRNEPWREAVASFFDVAAFRAHLRKITEVVIAGGGPAGAGGMTAAGAYLAGWLASRLGWEKDHGAETWRRRDGATARFRFEAGASCSAGEIAGVRIEARDGDDRVCFRAERVSERSPFVRLSIDAPASSVPPWKIKLPDLDETALLCGALQRSQRDRLYEQALEFAARMEERA